MRTEIDYGTWREATFADALFDAYKALCAAMYIKPENRDEVRLQCAKACGKLQFHMEDRDLALNASWRKEVA